jgi:hypothetical protein
MFISERRQIFIAARSRARKSELSPRTGVGRGRARYSAVSPAIAYRTIRRAAERLR